MRKSTFFLFLLSVLLLGTTEVIASSSSYTHTNTPIELEPASLNNSYQTAAVCFLSYGPCNNGDFGNGDDDMVIDTGKQCPNEGYDKTSCTLPGYLQDPCPYNNTYFATCAIDKSRACKESGYPTLTCEAGEVVDATCPYDNSYKKCKCDPCNGYDYTYAQATVQGYITDGSCKSCSTIKYKRKVNPCSGYKTCECGGEIGADICYTGSTKTFNSCKTCCNTACPAGTTEANPGGCGGSTQNDCKNKTCYYPYQACFNPYVTDCCDDIHGCKGPGFCEKRFAKYCTESYEICRSRGGVPKFRYCYSPGYINYDNNGTNAFIECARW